jgi:predicted Zn-dependent peptidase
VVAFPDQPLGRSILGTAKTVKSFDGAGLRDYLARNYRGPDMVVAAAGAVDHQGVVAEVERRFGGFNGPATPAPEPARFGGGSHVEERDLEQVHIALALPGVPQTDPTLYSLQAFTNVLGGGMSSRLFQEAREKRGLCYSIYSFHMAYSDVGMFGLYAGTDAADAPKLMRLIVEEIGNTAASLSETEIARVKAQMKAGLLMALESSGERVGQLARQMITYGRPVPTEELVAKVEAVTVDSARGAGRALLSRGKLATAVLGLGSGLESAAAIAESLTHQVA